MKNEIRNKELINDVLTFLPRNKTAASIINVLRSINLQIRKDYSEIYNEIISKKRDFIRCPSSHINISQGYEKFMTKNLYDARQDPETGGVKGQLSFLLTNLWTVTVDSSIAFPHIASDRNGGDIGTWRLMLPSSYQGYTGKEKRGKCLSLKVQSLALFLMRVDLPQSALPLSPGFIKLNYLIRRLN